MRCLLCQKVPASREGDRIYCEDCTTDIYHDILRNKKRSKTCQNWPKCRDLYKKSKPFPGREWLRAGDCNYTITENESMKIHAYCQDCYHDHRDQAGKIAGLRGYISELKERMESAQKNHNRVRNRNGKIIKKNNILADENKELVRENRKLLDENKKLLEKQRENIVEANVYQQLLGFNKNHPVEQFNRSREVVQRPQHVNPVVLKPAARGELSKHKSPNITPAEANKIDLFLREMRLRSELNTDQPEAEQPEYENQAEYAEQPEYGNQMESDMPEFISLENY